MEQTGTEPRPPRRRSRLVGLLIALAVLLLLIFGAAAYFTSSSFLVPRIERGLAHALHARVAIKGLHPSAFGETRVETIECYMPTPAWEGVGPFLILDDVRVALDTGTLLRGSPEVRYVRIGGVGARLSMDVIDQIRRQPKKPAPKKSTPWPVVEIGRTVIDVALPQYVEAFRVEDGAFRFGPTGGGQYSGNGSLRVRGNTVDVGIEANAPRQEFALTVRVPAAQIARLPRPAAAAKELAPVAFYGLLRGELTMKIDGARSAPPVWAGNFILENAGARREGWPVISRLYGRGQVDARGVRVQGVTGSLAGGRFGVDEAGITFGPLGVSDVIVRGYAWDLQADEIRKIDLFPAVSKALAENRIAGGTVDAAFLISRRYSWSYEVTATVRGMSAEPKAFPLPLRDIRGQARIRPESIEIERAQATAAGGRVRASGTIYPGQPIETARFDLDAAGLMLTEDALKHLPEAALPVVTPIGIQGGQVDGQVTYAQGVIAVTARVRNVALRPAAVPYSLTSLAADIAWSSNDQEIVFSNVRARHGSGVVSANGRLLLQHPPALSLTLEANSVPVDDELLSLVPEAARKRAADWRVAGLFNLSVNLVDKKLAPPAEGETWLTGLNAVVRLRGVSLTHEKLGTVLDRLDGDVQLNAAHLVAADLAGEAFGIEFTAGATADLDRQPVRLRAGMRSYSTRFSPDLFAQWPLALTNRLVALQPEGEFDLSAELRTTPGDSGAFAASATLSLHDVTLHTDGQTVQTSGDIRAICPNLFARQPALQSHIHLDYIERAGVYVQDVRTDLNLVNDHLEVGALRLQVYGGAITVTGGQIVLADQSWQARAVVEHLDLESLMAALGMRGREAPSGAARGSVNLAGRGIDRAALRADGRLLISRGRLYDLPIIASALSIFRFSLPRESPITSAYAAFRIEDSTLHLDNVLLTGGPIPIHIRGTMGLNPGVAAREQPLDLLISMGRPQGILNAVPILGWVKTQTFDRLRSQIIQGRVTGTMKDYEVQTVFSLVTAPITAMWNLVQRVPIEEAEGIIPGFGPGEQRPRKDTANETP